MRNIFDQYKQPENRLTHALVSALWEDEKLLRNFVAWITGAKPSGRLEIVEQRLPGENEVDEAEYEKRGLPDGWIYDTNEWSLLIESKVKAPLSVDQLKRHYKTAQKRGYSEVIVLAIDVAAPRTLLPEYVVFRSWREIYSWLSAQSRKSEWAQRTMRYMEVAEAKWPAEGYLKEGALTEFTGIHFDEQNPYNYGEAKRLIRLLMDELRQHPGLDGVIHPAAAGRGAIKGRQGTSVWDFLRLREARLEDKFDGQPHFTLSIGERYVSPIIILPNAMAGKYRRKLVSLGEERFFDVMADIEKSMRKVCRTAKGAKPWMSITQRHYLSRSSLPTVDGDISFDLRTAFVTAKSSVKYQPQWLSASYGLLTEKNSNITFALGGRMPYGECKKLKERGIVDSIVASWLACKPLIDVIMEA